MSTFDADQHNMSYLQLNHEQYRRHQQLMIMSVKDWPDSLKKALNIEMDRVGFSGDIMAVVVADWIRGGEK